MCKLHKTFCISIATCPIWLTFEVAALASHATVFLHIKSNTVRRKVTNGPSVTADKMRFLWRGESPGRTLLSSAIKAPTHLEETMKRLQKPGEETVEPPQNPALHSCDHRWVFHFFSCCPKHSSLPSPIPPSQKLTRWIVLTLWLDSCSSSPSKAAGSFPNRTETPCKIFHRSFIWTQPSWLQNNPKWTWQLIYKGLIFLKLCLFLVVWKPHQQVKLQQYLRSGTSF